MLEEAVASVVVAVEEVLDAAPSAAAVAAGVVAVAVEEEQQQLLQQQEQEKAAPLAVVATATAAERKWEAQQPLPLQSVQLRWPAPSHLLPSTTLGAASIDRVQPSHPRHQLLQLLLMLYLHQSKSH